jgi:serine/threonine protein kinase
MQAAPPHTSAGPGLLRQLRATVDGGQYEYVVHSVIGTGATSIVYQATERAVDVTAPPSATTSPASDALIVKRGPAEGRLVAIKAMESASASRAAVAKRSGDGGDTKGGDTEPNEAELLAQAHHPHVLSLIRHFAQDGKEYIVMEYLQGGTLYASMRSESTTRNGYSDRVAAQYMAQIVPATQRLHALNIVHRDIKAGNILLTDDRRVAKLADFGSARQLKDGATFPPLDAWAPPDRGSIPAPNLEGSVFWMSPEAMLAGLVHPCVDVWALGCLAIELLSGQPPFFDRSTKANVMWFISQLEQDPVDEWKAIPHLSPLAADFIASCMRLQPAKRLTTAQLADHPWIAGFRVTPPPQPIAVGDAAQANTPQTPSGAATTTPVRRSATGLAGASTSGPVGQSQVMLTFNSPSDALGRSDSQTDLATHMTLRATSGHDLLSVTAARPAHRSAVLETLERCCNPSNIAALARWLLGCDDPFVAFEPSADHPGCLVVNQAYRRAARESVALVLNEVQHAVNIWRNFNRQNSTASVTDSAELDAARSAAVSIVVQLAKVVAVWRDHVGDLVNRRVATVGGGLLAPVSNAPAAQAAGAVPNLFADYEAQLLADHQVDGARQALALTWLLLDSLTWSSFWSSGDLREMFYDCVSMARPGGKLSGTVQAQHAQPSQLGATDTSSPHQTSQEEHTESNLFEDSISSDMQSRMDDDVSPSRVPADIAAMHSNATDLDIQYERLAAAVQNLFTISALSVGVPSAAAYNQRIAGQATASPWALRMLITYDPTRHGTLRALATAMDADRLQRRMHSLSDAVCGMALSRLGPTYLDTAGISQLPPPGTPVLGDTTTGAQLGLTIHSNASSTAPALHEVKGWLANCVNFAARTDILDACTQYAVESRNKDGFRCSLRCLAGILNCISDVRQFIGSVNAGTLISAANKTQDVDVRAIAMLCLVQLALLDGDWAWNTFTLAPYLEAAMDTALSYPLRTASAASLVWICDRVGPVVFSNQGSTEAGGAKASRGSRVMAPSVLNVLFQLQAPKPDTADPVLASIVELAQLHKEYARSFADDHGFFRGLVLKMSKVTASRCKVSQALMMELVRELFVHTTDPGRFADSHNLCEALVLVANDSRSSRKLTLAACELINALANIAVF